MAEGRLKRCPHCDEPKPLDAFGRRKRSPSGRKSWCRRCEALRQQQLYLRRRSSGVCTDCGKHAVIGPRSICSACRAWRATARAARRDSGRCVNCGNPKLSGNSRCAACISRDRHRRLIQLRGVSETAYATILAQQQERCAICRCACATGRHLAVDHDHQTGRVRGLLCFRCNTALARYEEYSLQFAAYLRSATISAGPTL